MDRYPQVYEISEGYKFEDHTIYTVIGAFNKKYRLTQLEVNPYGILAVQ
jgi:hypothetical protein